MLSSPQPQADLSPTGDPNALRGPLAVLRRFGAERPAMQATDRVFVGLSALLAALVVGLAITGAARDHTGIPFWDMWEGYLGFFRRLSSGETGAWWAQHHEHRIVLARVVFWIDLALFGGHGIFLLVVNFALAAIIAAIFATLFLERTATLPYRSLRIGFALLLVAILFSGAQWENFRWGFQSQFFLAQLLPLAAFLTLQRSTVRQPGTMLFVAACTLGVLAAGTMANGVLALPLMTAQALVARIRLSRTAILAVLSAVIGLLYFHDYQPSPGHGSATFELTHHFGGVVAYVLAYLGGPLGWMLGHRFEGPGLGIVAGIVFCAFVAVALLRIARDRRDGVAIALATFIVFVIATATATAGGRLILGLWQAVSSRYATPTLMAWAAVIVLYAPALVAIHVRRRALGMVVLVAFASLVLVRHWKALPYGVVEPASQRLAALTLVLHIHDDEALSASDAQPDGGRVEAEWIEPRRLSFFGDPLFVDARARIGTIAPPIAGPHCAGGIRALERVAGESRYLRIAGTILPGGGGSSSPFVSVIDRDRRIVGIAVAGFDPDELKKGLATSPPETFTGYVLAPPDDATLALVAADGKCETEQRTPPPIRRRVVVGPWMERADQNDPASPG